MKIPHWRNTRNKSKNTTEKGGCWRLLCFFNTLMCLSWKSEEKPVVLTAQIPNEYVNPISRSVLRWGSGNLPSLLPQRCILLRQPLQSNKRDDRKLLPFLPPKHTLRKWYSPWRAGTLGTKAGVWEGSGETERLENGRVTFRVGWSFSASPLFRVWPSKKAVPPCVCFIFLRVDTSPCKCIKRVGCFLPLFCCRR